MRFTLTLFLLGTLALSARCALLEMSQDLWNRLLSGGISKIGSLDPLKVPIVKVDQSEGNTTYKMMLRNIEIRGLNKSSLESIHLGRGKLKSNLSDLEAGYVSYSQYRDIDSMRYRSQSGSRNSQEFQGASSQMSDRLEAPPAGISSSGSRQYSGSRTFGRLRDSGAENGRFRGQESEQMSQNYERGQNQRYSSQEQRYSMTNEEETRRGQDPGQGYQRYSEERGEGQRQGPQRYSSQERQRGYMNSEETARYQSQGQAGGRFGQNQEQTGRYASQGEDQRQGSQRYTSQEGQRGYMNFEGPARYQSQGQAESRSGQDQEQSGRYTSRGEDQRQGSQRYFSQQGQLGYAKSEETARYQSQGQSEGHSIQAQQQAGRSSAQSQSTGEPQRYMVEFQFARQRAQAGEKKAGSGTSTESNFEASIDNAPAAVLRKQDSSFEESKTSRVAGARISADRSGGKDAVESFETSASENVESRQKYRSNNDKGMFVGQASRGNIRIAATRGYGDEEDARTSKVESQSGFIDIIYADGKGEGKVKHFGNLRVAETEEDPRVYGLEDVMKDLQSNRRYIIHNFTQGESLMKRNDAQKTAMEAKRIRDLIRYAKNHQEQQGFYEEGMQLIYRFGDENSTSSRRTKRAHLQQDSDEDVMHVILRIKVPMLSVKSDYVLMGKVGDQVVRGNGMLTADFTDLIGDFTVELKKIRENVMVVRAARAKLVAKDKKVMLQGMNEKGPVQSVLSHGLMAAEAVAAMLADDLATKALSEEAADAMIYKMYKNLPADN